MRLTFAITILLLIAAEPAGAQVPTTPLTPASAAASDGSAYRGIGRGDGALRKEFPAPAGFRRVAVDDNPFGSWLRNLPIRRRTDVRAFDGRALSSPAAAIVPVSVGDRNLQQCADSIIRLHAEWLVAAGRSADLAYHFTSGDRVTYASWLAGERYSVDGAKVRRRMGERREPNQAAWRGWLEVVFMYAGTRSLARDSKSVEVSEVRPGDFYVEGGSPGHAVMVLDVAEHPDGRRVALLGQGFMPAQEFHVLRDASVADGVWFPLPRKTSEKLKTPSWSAFAATDVRRFLAD